MDQHGWNGISQKAASEGGGICPSEKITLVAEMKTDCREKSTETWRPDRRPVQLSRQEKTMGWSRF